MNYFKRHTVESIAAQELAEERIKLLRMQVSKGGVR
jgi:hypothetical protein